MALSAAQQDMISRMGQMFQSLFGMEGEINRYDVLYNDTPQWIQDITQDEINEVASLAAVDLTTQDVADALHILKQVRAQLYNINIPVAVKMTTLR